MARVTRLVCYKNLYIMQNLVTLDIGHPVTFMLLMLTFLYARPILIAALRVRFGRLLNLNVAASE
jgi:hypothetical protein